MTSDVTLYAFPPSHCSQKVRLALAEKGVAYRNRFVDIEIRLQNYEPDYLRLNPQGVVPTLVHGDRIVTNSTRIIRYIDEAFDGPRLTPVDASNRVRMDEWIELQDRLRIRELTFGRMQGAMGFALRRIGMPMRKRKLLRLRKSNPDLAELYDFKIRDLQQWRESIASDDEIAQARAGIEAALFRVEQQLDASTFLLGDDYTLADIVWTCVFARLRMLGLAREFLDAERSPNTDAYYARLRSRPSFETANVWEERPSPKARRALLKAVVTGSSEVDVEPTTA